MKKSTTITLIIGGVILVAAIVFLAVRLHSQQRHNAALQELALLDKQEMENEYQLFAAQYSEMRSQITNDSLITQLTNEQLRTQELLEELRQTKATDAAEITRLKKELATCRAVIRSYVLEIDSLNRLNQSLVAENTQVKAAVVEANKRIEGLSSQAATLSEKVAIAAQLDAYNISLTLLDKKGKSTTKLSKARQMALSLTLAKNVTAASGNKTIYIRISAPTGQLLGNSGTFAYENRTLTATAKKTIEYSGEETPVTIYYDISQALESGAYTVSVFADGNMIGSRTVTFK